VVRIFDKDAMRWITLPGVKLSEFRWYPTQVRRGARDWAGWLACVRTRQGVTGGRTVWVAPINHPRGGQPAVCLQHCTHMCQTPRTVHAGMHVSW
jgi:hypothetical protein